MRTLLLTQREVRGLLSTDMALSAVERALAVHGRDESVMPRPAFLPLEHYDGDFRAMTAYLSGAAGVKWVSSHPHNPAKHGMPALVALYVLSDATTAAPRAIMDGTLLTAYRTGATAAIATKYLATEPASLGVIGCGAQSRHVVTAHRALFPEISLLTADVSRAAAEKLAGEQDGEAASFEEAAAQDVVCTITPSRSPLVKREWLAKHAHINALGADAPGKQELDPAILSEAIVLVDDLAQAVDYGEIHMPIRAGSYTADSVYATLGELVAGRISLRRDRSITVFDSTGLAILDLALAQAIYEAAREADVGQDIDLTG